MQIEIRIDPACTEPRIIVETAAVTEEVQDLLDKLRLTAPRLIAGFRQDEVTLIDEPSISRLYAAGGKVLAVTDSGEYALRLRLYELEERLDKRCFARISNSEIVNLKRVKGFDLSLAGTICVRLSDGAVTYVSRRYVSRIKQVLGI